MSGYEQLVQFSALLTETMDSWALGKRSVVQYRGHECLSNADEVDGTPMYNQRTQHLTPNPSHPKDHP